MEKYDVEDSKMKNLTFLAVGVAFLLSSLYYA